MNWWRADNTLMTQARALGWKKKWHVCILSSTYSSHIVPLKGVRASPLFDWTSCKLRAARDILKDLWAHVSQ